MTQAHSPSWTSEIHKPVLWSCDVDHDDAEEFQNKANFDAHLKTCHEEHYTTSELLAIAEMSEITRPRQLYLCPLCDSLPEKLTARCSVEPGLLNESIMRDKFSDLDHDDLLADLSRHIAGHLRQLAQKSIYCLTNGDARLDDNDRSSAVRSQHVSWKGDPHLAAISLSFEEIPEVANLRVTRYQTGNSYDIEYSDYEPPESPPEQKNLGWVQSWVTWKEESDGLHKQSDDMDDVIGHFAMCQTPDSNGDNFGLKVLFAGLNPTVE